MKILCNDNEAKLLYNGLPLKLLYNYVEPEEYYDIKYDNRYETMGDNEINNVLSSITPSDLSKFFGSEATSINEENNQLNISFGDNRDYWYKLNNFLIQPNTNYIVELEVETNLAANIKIFGARLGNENSLYDCGFGYITTSNLVNGKATFEFTTPSEIYDGNGIMVGCLGNTTPSAYLNIISFSIKSVIYHGLDHMNWLTIGDSITAGVGTTKTYREFICEKTGLIDNGNSRISGGSISLIGDGTITGSGFTYMPNFISYTAKEKYLRPLLITIWLGTNDHIGNAPIGDETSTDVTEFWGSLNNFLPRLKEAYPNAYIIYFTPARKRNMGANKSNHELLDYINAIKQACKKYEITCCNLYNDTYDLLDIDNMTADGLHFNVTGHETVIAPYILSKIKKHVLRL